MPAVDIAHNLYIFTSKGRSLRSTRLRGIQPMRRSPNVSRAVGRGKAIMGMHETLEGRRIVKTRHEVARISSQTMSVKAFKPSILTHFRWEDVLRKGCPLCDEGRYDRIGKSVPCMLTWPTQPLTNSAFWHLRA